MSKAYSIDLRERVVEYVENGGTKVEAARIFKVSRDTVQRWVRQKSQTGHLAPKPIERRGGYKLKDAALQAHIKEHPDQTLVEIGESLNVHSTTVHLACKKMKITRKKNHTVQRKK